VRHPRAVTYAVTATASAALALAVVQVVTGSYDAAVVQQETVTREQLDPSTPPSRPDVVRPGVARSKRAAKEVKESPVRPSAKAKVKPSAPANPDRQGQQTNAGEALNFDYVFPIRHCDAVYARSHHDYPAADVFANRGCLFVSPVAGRVDEVTWTDTWDPARNTGATRGGLSVSVIGDDGVRYYGSHLQSVAEDIQPGEVMAAGQVLGRIGDSGSAQGTGTHLHFGISWPTDEGYWWIRRGMLAPQPYLDAWRAGRHLSPVLAVSTAERKLGTTSRCQQYC
jgi:murein DD-endopeptidase MepM/ murein hydrolase activator NlpD